MVMDHAWLPDECYSLFGKIIANYAQCRNTFNGSVYQVGSLFDSGLIGFINRVGDDELVELLGYLAGFNLPTKEAEHFKALLKRWYRSSDLRNKIAHSTWKFDESRNVIQIDEGTMKIGEQYVIYRRGRMRLAEKPKKFEISIAGLKDHVNRLETVIADYHAWFVKRNPELFGIPNN